MDATVEMIDELLGFLRESGMDKETALNVTLMVRTAENNRKMVRWMKENKTATTHQILEKAREINGKGIRFQTEK